MEVVGDNFEPDPIEGNIEVWNKIISNIGEAAIKIEKEFGCPQDIEGGVDLKVQEDTGIR